MRQTEKAARKSIFLAIRSNTFSSILADLVTKIALTPTCYHYTNLLMMLISNSKEIQLFR